MSHYLDPHSERVGGRPSRQIDELAIRSPNAKARRFDPKKKRKRKRKRGKRKKTWHKREGLSFHRAAARRREGGHYDMISIGHPPTVIMKTLNLQKKRGGMAAAGHSHQDVSNRYLEKTSESSDENKWRGGDTIETEQSNKGT